MALVAAGLNVEKNALAAAATHIALHSADPGATGANQTSAGRVAAGWPASANGLIVVAGKNFTGGAGNGPVTHVGLWGGATGGTFYGSFPIPTGNGSTNDVQFNAAGEYTLTSFALQGA
ncbi:hypothetical protein ASF21_12820 [Arthrobacter sp. Leaf234]|uniref:phage tail fiber protein n=1 Tax=Arthrobacter sp. Leaf234 TaxID=1736303 RepID=UPI0006F65A1F|nr:hypothetical protein [Arthrobacter sp. Leaf234]KQN99684.1 hypothetical protein ASF21_12820 [Arthrobacter sp. Leaf234]